MSQPTAIKTTRTLSEDFDNASPTTQKNVLMHTNGVKPTSKVIDSKNKLYEFEGEQHSPVTKSLLMFFGLMKPNG